MLGCESLLTRPRGMITASAGSQACHSGGIFSRAGIKLLFQCFHAEHYVCLLPGRTYCLWSLAL